MNGDDLILTRQVKLELVEMGQTFAVSQLVVESRGFDALSRHMAVGFRTSVLAQHVADDVFTAWYEEPASWWQMWKRDHESAWYVPAWFLRRWPARQERKSVEVQVGRYLHYPEATLRVPELGRAVIYERPSQMGGYRW